MNKKDKENTLSKPTAEERVGIDAVKNAEVSNPHPGDTESFDAESKDKKTEEFEKLIEGKYKEQFSKKVYSILSRRLKEVKTLKEQANKNEKIVQMLTSKLGIKDADSGELERMIDETMNQTANNENTKQTELIKRLVTENALLKRDREARLQNMQKKNFSENLKAQTEEVKKVYPEFDLRKEVENPEFCRLVKAGVGIKTAYEVIHIDGILDNTSKEAEKMVLDSIRYKGNRPVENGSEPTGGILLSSNVGKLTKKQRAELAKRAASGEKIEF